MAFRPPAYAYNHSSTAYDDDYVPYAPHDLCGAQVQNRAERDSARPAGGPAGGAAGWASPLPGRSPGSCAARNSHAVAYDEYGAYDPYSTSRPRPQPRPVSRPYTAWTPEDARGTDVPYRSYGLGQGDHTIGGPAACTTIAVVAAVYAFDSHPDRLDVVKIMSRAAAMWRRDSGVFQSVREVLSDTRGITGLVQLAKDDIGEMRGRSDDQHNWSDEERHPNAMLHTVSSAVDVLDAARRAIAAMTVAQRTSPRFTENVLENVCAVLTSNGGSTLLVATPDGVYYELDSHGTAALYRFQTRAELERAIRKAARPDPQFAIAILVPLHTPRLGIVAPPSVAARVAEAEALEREERARIEARDAEIARLASLADAETARLASLADG